MKKEVGVVKNSESFADGMEWVFLEKMVRVGFWGGAEKILSSFFLKTNSLKNIGKKIELKKFFFAKSKFFA